MRDEAAASDLREPGEGLSKAGRLVVGPAAAREAADGVLAAATTKAMKTTEMAEQAGGRS
jgi:hypothetical protein